MSRIRVLLADDHALLRDGLRALLTAEEDLEVVGEAGDGSEALAKARDLAPDVVLLDIHMPGLSGLEATKPLLELRSNLKVLILTMYDNEEYLFQVLRMGASGYVLKRSAAGELVSAIRTVHGGHPYLSPLMTKKLVSEFLSTGGREAGKLRDGLTPREGEILKHIAEGRTNQETADTLCLSIKTVQTHRAHILEKLGLHNQGELIKYAIQKGIIDI
ncbi:MAG: response regulator transcription factor [Armatimonadetes bacterium]|nr:response regulator transcription factor [Armatimonadota bacterium]